MSCQSDQFHAKVYVQGAGNWVRRENGPEIMVLFPDSEIANDKGLRTVNGEEFCRHHAVLQCESQHLWLNTADVWTTLDLSRQWIRIDADGPEVNPFDPGSLDSLPDLEEILEVVGSLGRPNLVDLTFTAPDGSDTDLAKAGLILHQGTVEPEPDHLAHYVFGPDLIAGDFSNVHCVDLGMVTSLSLQLREFDSQVERTLDFRPPPPDKLHQPGLLTLWIRHFCDVSRPDGNTDGGPTVPFDPDFNINFLEQSEAVRSATEDFPPFADDSPGGETKRCMGARAGRSGWADPFG